MKKLTITTIVIFIAVVAGLLFIRESKPDSDITSEVTNVGLLIRGTKDDNSYCQSHYDALLAIKDKLNLKIICKELVEPDDSYAAVMELIDMYDCEVIVASSYEYDDSVMKAAKKNPTVSFLCEMGEENASNVSSYMGRVYQARYLSGIVAGLRTETGEIGYVAAYSIPEVIRGLNAFTLGVKSVREDAVVHVRYSDSWIEDEPSGREANYLIENYPIDVMAVHTNSLQPLIEADKVGMWTIGYNVDNYDMFPDTYLTACEWNWQVYYEDQITKHLQTKFHGSTDWIDMSDGIVKLSELTPNVAEGTDEAVKAAEEKIESRSFDVFYGPITDNQGNLRVDEGESMSDYEMYNNFDWYVEGVQVEE